MSKARDPYIDEKTRVLKNKLGIDSQGVLEQFESDIVPARIIALRKNGFELNSVYDIKKIHEFLFSPIFEWAGEFRSITIFKSEPILEGASVDYTPASYIEKEMGDLEKEFLAIKWDSLSTEDKVSLASRIIQQLWQIHCFREGNTRSIGVFMYFLLKRIDLHVNSDFISKHSKYFRNSLVLASCYSRSKPQYLQGIIADSVSVKSISEDRYTTLDGYEVERYAYSYHTIEELKTVKSLQEIERNQDGKQ